MWKKETDDSRTTARLLLTLSLTSSLFPNASVGGMVYVRGGVVDFGDGVTYGEEGLEMEVRVMSRLPGLVVPPVQLL